MHRTVADISHLFLTNEDTEAMPPTLAVMEKGEAPPVSESDALSVLPQLLAEERLQALAAFLARMKGNLGNRIERLQQGIETLKDLHLHNPADRRYLELRELAGDAREDLESLLLFAQMRPPVRREIRMADVVRLALHLAHPEFHSRGITARWTESQHGLTVHADPGLMEQALFHILKNAWEAIEKGPGLVQIAIRAIGDERIIDIADSGSGMGEDVLKRAFEPYFTTKSSHAGLGLSRAWGIVQAHGGKMTLTSAPCEGTVITIGLSNTL